MMNKQGYMTIIRGFKTMKTWIEAHEGEKFTVFFASTFCIKLQVKNAECCTMHFP